MIMVRSDEKVLLAVTVTDEMVKDLLECERMANESDFEQLKDCDSCSWKDTEIGNTCMCELIDLERLREKK